VNTDSASQPWMRVDCAGRWLSAVAFCVSGGRWASGSAGGVGIGCCGSGVWAVLWRVVVPTGSFVGALQSAAAGGSGIISVLGATAGTCGVEVAVGELQKLSSFMSIAGARSGISLCLDAVVGAFVFREVKRFFKVLNDGRGDGDVSRSGKRVLSKRGGDRARRETSLRWCVYAFVGLTSVGLGRLGPQ
jgi:hypothetical protein